MLARLERAKAGDEAAHAEVALYCFNKYKGRIGRLYSLDPAIGKEDLEATFFEAIMKMVPKLDHRGNPFYRAGQQGWWAVASELRAIKSMLEKRAPMPRMRDDADGTDWLERLEDRLEPDFREVVVAQMAATDTVRAVTSASLKPPAQRALAIIYSGKLTREMTINDELREVPLFPDDLGFNKALAQEMGCSPQRVSQIMNEIREVGGDVALPWED